MMNRTFGLFCADAGPGPSAGTITIAGVIKDSANDFILVFLVFVFPSQPHVPLSSIFIRSSVLSTQRAKFLVEGQISTALLVFLSLDHNRHYRKTVALFIIFLFPAD
ncbi:MAG: hypothetical protein ABSC19_17145 [Syntrophorhabdales bacterium]